MKIPLPKWDFRYKNNHNFSKKLTIKLIKLQIYKTVSNCNAHQTLFVKYSRK
jgi:hypothetical protein